MLLAGQGLQDQLGQTLAGPHGVGWPHGFIGRDQHECFNPCLNGRLCRIKSAEYVVTYPFNDVELNQRDMFVSSRMVDGLDPEALHHRLETMLALH